MLQKLFFQLVVILLSLLISSGCSTLQYVSYSVPSLSDSSIKTSRFGDGIAFNISETCIAVREQSPSAEYWNLFLGPLVFPIFPWEIFGFFGRSQPDQFWVTIDVQPREFDLALDLSKAWLITQDGKRLTVKSFGLHHHYEVPHSIQPFSDGMEPIAIPVGYHFRKYGGPFATLFALGFDKPSPDSQMSHFEIEGLTSHKGQISFPKVTFSPKTAYLRMLFSGQGRDNISPIAYSGDGLCGKTAPKD